MNANSQPAFDNVCYRTRLVFFGLMIVSAILASGASRAEDAVPIDQQPLTVQKSLAPNLVLMLDDSGSMNWDIMPDYGYLKDTSSAGLVNASINGVYYNPTEIYTPPPKVDGSLYPDADFDAAWVNGFDPNSATVDLSTYRGRYDTFNVNYSGTPVRYSISVAKADAPSYKYGPCPSGSKKSKEHPGYCYYTDMPADAYNFFDGDNSNFYVSRCSSIQDVYNDETETCTPGISFFTYTTTDSNDNFTRHYVAKDKGDCTAAGLSSTICTESDTVKQNVANWFAYYHTRMLMAKSGMMNAFDQMDPKYRLGFGSINNSNKAYIGSLDHTYKRSTYIAKVAPFGNGTSDTQRAHFWNWVTGVSANSSTPLRRSLQAVGDYYENDEQPWTSKNKSTGNDEYLACRQSYAILTTDGFWNGSDPGLGNVDGTNGPEISRPDGSTDKYEKRKPFSDDVSDTLADVAMHYWSRDLQPNIDNQVPSSSVDRAFWQHMVTFTLGMGFKPTGIKPEGTRIEDIFSWANGGTAIPDFSWPKPGSDSVNNIADLAHAAVNGHGGFYSAATPESFAAGLKDLLARTAQRTGMATGVAANSTELDTDTYIYASSYTTNAWTGDLAAYTDKDHAVNMTLDPPWSAAKKLSELLSNEGDEGRHIFTYVPGVGDPVLVDFKWVNLASAERTALGDDAASQKNMVSYLRGDRSLETSNEGDYRARQSVLGDIVHSQPVYVGAANPDVFAGESFPSLIKFPDYVTTTESRTAVVYVAANDGMLHGFNADTGDEVFAYLPAAVISSGLKDLADPDYGKFSAPHRYFNDGELTVADAFDGTNWRTVLVGTTGRASAKAVYALDVTDPDAITLLWERSAGDNFENNNNSNYIGQIIGRPVIAKTDDDTWSVLMGNGYNSPNGTAALLQFDLFHGDLTVYTTNGKTGNGLAAPAVWIGDPPTDGVSTVAYAGDLKGGVWSFSLGSGSASGTQVFTASTDDSGTDPQPITAGMLLTEDPDTNNLWLFFGTGRWLSSDDLTGNIQPQSWYGIIVKSADAQHPAVGSASSTRKDLTERQVSKAHHGSTETRVFDDPDPLALGTSGWFVDLPDSGEQIVTPSQLEGRVLFNTSRVSTASDVCNPAGSGWLLYLDAFTGARLANNFVDLSGDHEISDNDNSAIDGDTDGNTHVTGGFKLSSTPNLPVLIGGDIFVSQSDQSIAQKATGGAASGTARVSWRELVNP